MSLKKVRIVLGFSRQPDISQKKTQNIFGREKCNPQPNNSANINHNFVGLLCSCVNILALIIFITPSRAQAGNYNFCFLVEFKTDITRRILNYKTKI